jgi:hypothetical protein
MFPIFAILPEKDYGSAFGVLLLETLGSPDSEVASECDAQAVEDVNAFRRRLTQGFDAPPCESGPSLHDAFQKYIDWLKVEYQDPDTTVASWERTQVRQVESLIAHHADLPLTRLGRDKVEEMLRYWRQRPLRKGKNPQQISKKSATHFIGGLRSFFKWLHVQPAFHWRKCKRRSNSAARGG